MNDGGIDIGKALVVERKDVSLWRADADLNWCSREEVGRWQDMREAIGVFAVVHAGGGFETV